MDLRPAGEADLPFIMATERMEGYQALVGRWDEGRHRTELAGPEHRYMVALEAGHPEGFVILKDWDGPDKRTYLRRIAVARPGEGRGRRLLGLVCDRVFGETDAWRLWLNVFPENHRARRAYEAAGFVAEGIARGGAFFDGVHRDQMVMAILRPDWEALRARDA